MEYYRRTWAVGSRVVTWLNDWPGTRHRAGRGGGARDPLMLELPFCSASGFVRSCRPPARWPFLTSRSLTSAFEMQLYSRALLLSQAGPRAAGAACRALTIFPTAATTVPSAHFRALLLRRQRLPLPIAPRTCACRGHLDPFVDHTAECATSGRWRHARCLSRMRLCACLFFDSAGK